MPAEENHFLCQHVAMLRHSFRHWTKQELVAPAMGVQDAARYLFQAPFAVVSHDTAKAPIFNYANQAALSLFAMSWDVFTSLPSRMSSEPVEQPERQRILDEVTEHGFIDHYSAVKIGRHGRRFQIENAVIWNLLDRSTGVHKGQAALIRNWKFL